VQRAAERVTAVRLVVVVDGVVVRRASLAKGESLWWSCMMVPASGSVCASGARQVSAAQ
jgi:hypothetical protein